MGTAGAEVSDDFWQSVRDLAAMRAQIPEERRRMSAVRMWLREVEHEQRALTVRGRSKR